MGATWFRRVGTRNLFAELDRHCGSARPGGGDSVFLDVTGGNGRRMLSTFALLLYAAPQRDRGNVFQLAFMLDRVGDPLMRPNGRATTQTLAS